MFYRRLNSDILLNLVILLALAMLLIDFVLMGAAQNLLLKSRISEGELLIHAITHHFSQPETHSQGNKLEGIDTLVNAAGFSNAVILDRDLKKRYAIGKTDISSPELFHAARRALASQRFHTELTGSTWGVFWRQKANLILSAPIYQDDILVAGIGIVVHLEGMYRQLRRAQHLVFIYFLFNLVLLTFIGYCRFYKSTMVPLKKLVETAEDYQEGGRPFFLGTEKEGNEFNQLSTALNQMLHRISDDQDNLKRTVCSLEQANLSLKKAQTELINAEKLASVGRLSAGIAHEIGNPLAIVTGYLELLKRDDISDSERKDFIARTESEIQRINQIIRQLLDFSRPSNSTVKRISVHEILSDISAIFKYQPLMKNVDFKLRLAAAKDGVRADEALLRQAFLNLIINAVDTVHQTNRHPKELSVETRNLPEEIADEPPRHLEIIFKDNGAGIPIDQLHYIFEPFYTTKAPGKGTGLGLSVCYMIVEASGGRIKAHCEEGIGTKMIMELPLCAGEYHPNV